MNRYFEHIKLKCVNIEPYCDKAWGGARQMWRWLAGYSCGMRRGEEREKEMDSGGSNGLYVQKRDISRYKTKNTIVMVLSKNDNTSKLFIFLCIAEHFLPSRTTQLDNLPV